MDTRTMSGSGTWSKRVGTDNLGIASNQASKSAGGATVYYDSAESVIGPQRASLDMINGQSPAPAVRVQSDGSGYFIYPTGALYRSDAGVATLIGAATVTPANGATIMVEALGAKIRGYVNGVEVTSAVDATYLTGRPGIFADAGGGLADNWTSFTYTGSSMDRPTLRLLGLNPMVENSNASSGSTSYRELKAGPQFIWWDSVAGLYRMVFECIKNTSGGTDDDTGIAQATASYPWGPWSYNGELLNDISAAWKTREASIGRGIFDGVAMVCWGHGGNNTGPRQLYHFRSTDGLTGLTWADDASAPHIAVADTGLTGTDVADIKLIRLRSGTYFALARIVSSTDKTFVLTGTVSTTLTTLSGGPHLTNGSAGQADSNGAYGAVPLEDAESERIFAFYSGLNGSSVDSICGAYSDDGGKTWTKFARNALLSRDATDNRPDHEGCGDVLDCFVDPGHYPAWAFLTYGGFDLIGGGPGGGRWSNVCMTITPIPVTAAFRPGKVHWYDTAGGTRSLTSDSSAALLSVTTFIVVGEFQCVRADANYRHLYTEYNAFNIGAYLRIDGSSSNYGKIEFFVRNGGSIATARSTARFDDGQKHQYLFVRTAIAAFELFVDGVSVATSSTSVATSAAAFSCSWGNWASNPDEPTGPFLGAMSRGGKKLSEAWTWAQAAAWFANRNTLPSTALDFELFVNGTDAGDVVTVETATETEKQTALHINQSVNRSNTY